MIPEIKDGEGIPLSDDNVLEKYILGVFKKNGWEEKKGIECWDGKRKDPIKTLIVKKYNPIASNNVSTQKEEDDYWELNQAWVVMLLESIPPPDLRFYGFGGVGKTIREATFRAFIQGLYLDAIKI